MSTYDGVMPMTHTIAPVYYNVLYKLVKLYFATQYLELPRYLLVRDVPADNIRNVIFGFSDGSAQFSTSCIYLLSYYCKSDKYIVTLVSTLWKLADKTKSTLELEKNNMFNTVPKREAHGLVLACNGALTLALLLQKLQLNLTEVMSNDVNNVCCKLILASDPVTDVKRKFNIPKYEILWVFCNCIRMSL